MMFKTLLAASAAAAVALAAPAYAQAQPAQVKAASKAVAELPLDIPYTRYVLNNGLTLIVHEDRKAPIVAVNIWYHVGSKNEPRGRSGFAHLFEHLMFNGSENFNDDYFKATQKIGATNLNGTTNLDRTNYFQNVPKEALDTILWLESDRMGHLLGAVDEAKLTEQRGVVQNEKRQGENQPYGQTFNLVTKATYPEEHPYGHTVIGSMEDLDAATLEDAREWFRTYYGASNAVIVLAGDISPEEAKAKVEKYFGEIPPGPPVAHPKVWIAKRSGAQREVAYDRVAAPRLVKVWNIPQYGDRDGTMLEVLGDALAGDKTSRLYKRLVFDEQIATDVSAGPELNEIAGRFWIQVTGKPDADIARIEAIVEEELGKMLAQGPTASEVEKARTRRIAATVRGLERVGGFGGKSDILARHQTFLGDPDAWKTVLAQVRAATSAEVRAAGQRWLSDGSYTLTTLPFPAYAASSAKADRSAVPAAGEVAPAVFPAVQRATLSNGLRVMLVERRDLPMVNLRLMVDTGYGPDFAGEPAGVGSLAVSLLDEGTTKRDALALSDELSRLGATLNAFGGGETSGVQMSLLKPTLDAGLDIFGDVIRNPAFRPADFERQKALQIAAIQRAKRDPQQIANRVVGPLLYGPDHPYGRLATEESLAAVDRNAVAEFHRRWFRPNNATLIVVGDVTLAELTPKLETALAGWAPGETGRIAIPDPTTRSRPVIYLVDRPDSVQSVIVAATTAPPRTAESQIGLDAFNNVFGGSFTSRINMNLREDKHWSYGARSMLSAQRGPRTFRAQAPVQTDKTKESMVELAKEMREILKDRRITPAELAAAQSDLTLGLSGRWEAAAAVTESLSELVTFELPDDYFSTYAEKIRALDPEAATEAGAPLLADPNPVWIVVGDRAKIEKGLRELNLGEIRVIDADGNPV